MLALLMVVGAPATVLAEADAESLRDKPLQKVDDVVVIGNPLDARDVVAPASSLSGTELLLKRASTLGETLNSLPGVSSTWYGANASRPIIRGLDADRIRVLNNQGATFDASSLSPDHAVSLDPLVIDRVEVLRGPAAMLYGGTAIGGVVNVVDNRIPRDAIEQLSGTVETRAGGAEREQGSSGVLEFGQGGFALHADGFVRDTDDYRVPISTGVGRDNGSRVVNSSGNAKGGALGASWQLAKGYVGFAHSEYATGYGTIVEPGVRVGLQQLRDSVEANFSHLDGVVESAFAKVGRSRYEHAERDDGEVQTRFKNEGSDLRLEFRHLRIGAWQGVFGIQAEQFAFSALGAEAFIPQTHTQNRAVFGFEEWNEGAWRVSLGGRIEQSAVQSDGSNDNAASRFGLERTRRFNLGGLAIGANWQFSKEWSFSANTALAQRAPTFYELYANGPHGATHAYEVGDDTLGKERSTALDLGVRWKTSRASFQAGLFSQQFQNFLLLRRTGNERDTDGNGGQGILGVCANGLSERSGCTAEILPEFRYQSVSARLRGFELEGKVRALDGLTAVDVEAKADAVRADDVSNRSPLPRIVPMRTTLGVALRHNDWRLRIENQFVTRQNRASFDDVIGPTVAYQLLNASVTWAFELPWVRGTVFLRGSNLTNREAYSASSIDTIRNLAPLPGRGVKVGVQASF